MNYIVDRKTWYRGHGYQESCLLREDGMRCCIGFVGKQCGVPDSKILNRNIVQDPDKLKPEDVVKDFPDWMYDTSLYADITTAYSTNDDPGISDAKRESKLKVIFVRHGDTIEFIN